MLQKILKIEKLKKYYPVLGGVLQRKVADVKALDSIDLNIFRGECLGLVGESGCGKTTTGKAIIRLHDPTEGHIHYYPSKIGIDQSADIATLKKSAIKKTKIQSLIFFPPFCRICLHGALHSHVNEPQSTTRQRRNRFELPGRFFFCGFSILGLTLSRPAFELYTVSTLMARG